MIDPFSFIILCLAAYRVTRFLVKDSLIGMGDDSGSWLSVKVDKFAYDAQGLDRSSIRGRIGDLLTCSFCLGFWVSSGLLAAWTWSWPWGQGQQFQIWVATAFAIAGVQAYISSRMNA